MNIEDDSVCVIPDVDESKMNKEIEMYKTALHRSSEMLVRMKHASDCWEFRDDCPFADKCSEDTNYCYDIGAWEQYLLSEDA